MMHIPSEFELVTKSADFLLRSRPDVFSTWPKPTMIKWLQHHIKQRAVGIVADNGNIEAVGVGWRSQMPDIDDRWANWDDKGDCFYFDQLHATNPTALVNLICLFEVRVPNWTQLRLIADRHGKRVRLHPKVIQRLFTYSEARS